MNAIESIKSLVSKIDEIVAQCDEEDVIFNSCKAKHLIDKYCGEDWRDSVKFDQKRYNRILLYNGKKFDIWLICWDIGQRSGIHDHPENGCVQKVLQGGLGETRYIKEQDGTYYKWKRRIYIEGDVGYICGKKGVHMLENVGEIGAVTLHLYSPPNYIPRIIAV